MRYLESDREYQKVWCELQALAWNRPELRERVAHVDTEWRAVLTEAFAEPHERYGIAMPLDALVSLVITFNEGIILERLSGIETGQAELLQWIDGLASEERATMTTIDAPAAAREQTRARYPDEDGYVERAGVRLFYEVYGSGEPTILLLPTWSIIHSRHWKAQIPYLARHARVVTFDGRGNGRTDRPATADAYSEREFAADALAVMDATGTERAVVVGIVGGRAVGRPARRRAPGARGRRGVHRARRAVRPAPGARRARRSTSRSSPTRAGASTTATTGSSTTATSSSSSSARSSRSRTRPSRSRTAWAGASRPRARPWR